MTKKAERVGKKYQWIALYEILAFISDHFQYRDRYTNASSNYHGPWQSYRRDIDPSLLQPAARDQPLRNDLPNNWWGHSDAFDWGDDVDAQDWVDRKDELPDVGRLLQFTSDEDGATWLNIHGMLTWEQPTPPTHDQWETAGRRVWVNMTGYLLGQGAAAETLNTQRDAGLWDQRLSKPATTQSLFFGEVGWSPGFWDLISEFDKEGPSSDADWLQLIASSRPAAMNYSFEAGEYDCSLSAPVNVYRPEWQTAESMRLRWTGLGADFKNAAGELVASDPSALDSGPPALIIRESDLADYLEENGLALIWVVIGERCAFNIGRPNTWDGSLHFSGVYEYTPAGPKGSLATELRLPDND